MDQETLRTGVFLLRTDVEVVVAEVDAVVDVEGVVMAVRDKSQGIVFVYDNVMELYRKAQASQLDAPAAIPGKKAVKIPSSLVSPSSGTSPKIRIPRKAVGLSKADVSTGPTFEELRKNMDRLKELHGRLRFMLFELETVLKKS